MTWRRVLICIGLALLVILVSRYPAPAWGAETAPVPVEQIRKSEAGKRVQALNHKVNVYLRSVGFDVEFEKVLVGNDHDWQAAFPTYQQDGEDVDVAAYAGLDGATVISKDIAQTIGVTWPPLPEGAQILIHEQLHQITDAKPGNYGSWTDDERWWAEAATEAVTQDLLPRFYRKNWPNVQYYGGLLESYPRGTAAFRAVSARATNSKWFSVLSRRWRYAYIHANADLRSAMLRQGGIS